MLLNRLSCVILNRSTQVEVTLFTLVYAVFVVTDQVLWVGVAALGLVWLVRFRVLGRFSRATPLDYQILALLVLLPVTLGVSVDWELSLPKVYGLLLGIIAFYVTINAIEALHDLWLVALALLWGTILIAMIGMVGTEWPDTKLISLPFLYERLPQLITNLPRSIGGGFHPNAVAGTLVLLIPLLLCLVRIRHLARQGLAGRESRLLRVWAGTYRYLLIFSLILALSVLVLTKSRGAFLGLTAALWGWMVLHNRGQMRGGVIAALVVVLLVLLGLAAWVTDIAWLLRPGSAPPETIAARLELWQRGLYMVQDFPFTGIGIGTFDLLLDRFYPLFSVSLEARVTHVHNQLLQIAVDMGLPALVAYVALLVTFAVSARRTYVVAPNALVRALIVGLTLGMLAHQVFGIPDAFQLGSKPGLVTWIVMGTVAALYVRHGAWGHQATDEAAWVPTVDNMMDSTSTSAAYRRCPACLVFACWLFFSLVAIALVGPYPYLGLTVTVIGGLVQGVVAVVAFELSRC